MKIENFLRTKSRRNFLERLIRKVDIFIATRNIFNPKKHIRETFLKS